MSNFPPRPLPLAVVAAAAAFAVSGCGEKPAADTATAPVASGKDAPRSARSEANQLLPGGTTAFRARLDSLRGSPVVVNQWASWCGPCRYEFPFFAQLAKRYDGRVAFLGVNSQDSRKPAEEFLKRHPVPFPHFVDPDGEIARTFRGGRSFPTTAFYAADGKLVYTHVGSYPNQAALDEEIKQYLLDG